MHFSVSYIGTIGSLMVGTRIYEGLGKVFGSVPKLLADTKYPQCVRALRLLGEELLHPIRQNKRINMLQEHLMIQ